MKIKIIAFLTLIIFNFNTFYAQDKFYLDENIVEIDSIEFKKKCKIHILKCLTYKTNSVEVNKVLYDFAFGKLSPIAYEQIKKTLIQKSLKNIDNDATLLINYRDSLYDFEIRKKNYDIHIQEHKDAKHHKFTFETFDKSRKKWISKQQKCSSKIDEKFNTATFYVYNFDYGSIEHYPDLGWIKDRSIFKNIFFQIYGNYRYLVLKPDGEYFLCGSHFSDSNLKYLLKNKDWTKIKSDFKESYVSESSVGVGRFKKGFNNHLEHCF
ncbi:hypothetical protein [Lutibacter sp.]|uniref:hypothetical protein n=1 Tax=Lutibacter sp. TaxID=1925666 RepID=UPI0034A03ED2